MKFEVEKVLERDIDLLMIDNFIKNKNLADFFCKKVGLEDYKVIKVQHSVTDDDGESDITITLEKDNSVVAFLIEDKIDAIAMPNQRKRYTIRGEKGIVKSLYEKYYIFIIAPKQYLESNEEAKKYENQISYEELIDVLNDDIYAKKLLEKAIEEKKNGYMVIENQNVTQSWKKYYDYVEQNYPNLNIHRIEGPRGSYAHWQHFSLPLKNTDIIHKINNGYVDLTFSGIADKYEEFYSIVGSALDNDMKIYKTKKSLAVRIIVPTIDMSQEFTNYMSEMKMCMDAVTRLKNLLNNLDTNKIQLLTGV